MVKRDPNALYCDDPSLTQQHFAQECDINYILDRCVKSGGVIDHVNPKAPLYGDFTNLPDYRGSFEVVKKAEELFMSLDWRVRERFGNDPQEMLNFVADERNREEAVKLGLVKAPEPKAPVSPAKGDSGANEGQPVAATK